MKTPVSLVLSSGGARGIAHIGVIAELQRQGYEISAIAGSSMGAVVGGMYASGKLDAYRDWMCRLDKKAVFSLVDFTISTNGLVKGSRVINALKQIVPDVSIEDLPVAFTAVATDIRNRKEVIFDRGSLFEAIRASISIPTVFIPFMLDEMMLIDGGVINPLPINRVKRREGDLLIAVDLNAHLPAGKENAGKDAKEQTENESAIISFIRKKGLEFFPGKVGDQLNYYSLLTESVGLMVQQISALTIDMCRPDIVIKISKDAYGTFDFYKSEEIILAGAMAARKALE